MRYQTKQSFANTVSGVDLIVGARTGRLNLLLYSVFRIGSPTNNITWESFEDIASKPQVKWAIPIVLGDSHRGYPVMGTTGVYFEFFSYGNQRGLTFEQGHAFNQVFDVVIGSDIARTLGYSMGEKVVLSHGLASTSFSQHDDRPFKVVGILAPTGTPVDQTLHVSLAGIEAIHIGWQQGIKMPAASITTDHIKQLQLQPESITAFMLGLKSRMATFRVQRTINEYGREPLLAILPGVALSELWQMMNVLENTLRLISVLILIAALLGLSAMLLASIRERNHEVQLLRIIGAPPIFLFLLIELEALLIILLSTVLGVSILYACLVTAGNFLASEYGLYIQSNILSGSALHLVLIVIIANLAAAAIPALTMYKSAKKI
jgi:putative ABC transport system permease protein